MPLIEPMLTMLRAAGGAQVGHGVLAAVERAAQVHVEHPLPQRRRCLFQGRARKPAHVIDQDVQPAEGADRGIATGGPDGCHDGLAVSVAHVTDHHARPFAGQHFGAAATDTPGRAGDHRDLTLHACDHTSSSQPLNRSGVLSRMRVAR